jgi:mRNA interferase RelE/StbE
MSSAGWGSDALSDKAERQIEKLPAPVQKRVARWLGLLAEDPYRKPSCQLEGYPELRRVHASKDWVIVYSILGDEIVVLVVRVAHRREVYRRL